MKTTPNIAIDFTDERGDRIFLMQLVAPRDGRMVAIADVSIHNDQVLRESAAAEIEHRKAAIRRLAFRQYRKNQLEPTT